MDTATRLAELAAEFRARSEAKHRAAGLAGHAEIVYFAPFMAWSFEPQQSRRPTYQQHPQYWEIIYVDGQGGRTNGVVLGRTRAAVIRWLLQQRRAWP